MDLIKFGQTLRKLRKLQSLTQIQLAEKISVTSVLISNWERAYVYNGRRWEPDQPSVLRLVQLFAPYMEISGAERWVEQAGFKLTKQEIQTLFPHNDARPLLLTKPPDEAKANYRRLELETNQRLFGADLSRQQMSQYLHRNEEPWIIALAGIGGIGKTALALALVKEFMAGDRFFDVVWISAKQEVFTSNKGLETIARPALNEEGLAELLMQQVAPDIPMPATLAEKQVYLGEILKQKPFLVVVDNLETIIDYEAILPMIQRLTNPTKFLLTTRHALYNVSGIYSFQMEEIKRSQAGALLQYEAEMQGLAALRFASGDQIARIFMVVGGHPLALKLIVGQTHIFSLDQVLENLKMAYGKTNEDIFLHIYRHAWQALDLTAQKALLVMPLANGGKLSQIQFVTKLDMDELVPALQHLVKLSLVFVTGGLDSRRYHIHRLTEIFLLRDLLNWPAGDI